LEAQRGKLDYDLSTSTSLGTPSILSFHDCHPFAPEDGDQLATTVAELVDRLAVFVALHRVPGMGATDSRSLRYDSYVSMLHFNRRSTYVPFRGFIGDVRR
jgi:hypothetical protein